MTASLSRPSRLIAVSSAAMLSVAVAAPVCADGPDLDERPLPVERGKESENFHKTGRFLPGEEVVTSTGKKMRVWSTEGPVPVSRPPEPFEDRTEWGWIRPHVVIDGDRDHHRGPRRHEGHDRDRPGSGR